MNRTGVISKNRQAQLFCIFLVIILSISSWPSSILAQTEQKPQLQSQAAILIDADTGQVLFQQNESEKMYPASITKIVTGIIAIEEGDLEDIVTVSENARQVEGTRVFLETGEQVSLLKLVQGLLINSGNDAGVAIAEHMDGSEEKFAERMNRFVREKAGVIQTNFTNPHGLFHEEHYTTAYDMALISRYAMQNEQFREIVGTYELDWVGEGWITTIYNHNRLLGDYEGATGIKNGFVQLSGYTLVGSAKRGELELIAVTLNAPSANQLYKDMTALLDYGFEHFEKAAISRSQTFFDAEGHPYKPAENITYYRPKDVETKLKFHSNGLLSVYTQDEEKLFETVLQKVDIPTSERKASVKISSLNDGQSMAKEEAIQETSPSGFLIAMKVVLWLYALFLLVIAVLLYRKKKREAKLNSMRRIFY